MSKKKTKIMVIDKERSETDGYFILDGEIIEEVNEFIYLGSCINIKGKSE